MRNPNNYGTITNLGSGRRKPIAVKVPNGVKITSDSREIRQYKYIGYFENTPQGRKDAIALLAEYNQGRSDITSDLVKKPAFKQLAEEWLDRHERQLSTKNSTNIDSNMSHYRAGLKKCLPILEKPINIVTYNDIQTIADNVSHMGKSSVLKLKGLLNGTFDLARKHKYITENFIDDVEFNYSVKDDPIHSVFTNDEVKKLWELSEDQDVKALLIMIYTGLRATEFMRILNENIHLEERYFIGGMKTDAGRDRIVPIHERIVPFIEYFMSDNEYFFTNGSVKWSYSRFQVTFWTPLMKRLGMNHLPHDTRYTCASLLDRANANPNCIKDILGHAREGITNQVYVKKNIKDLIEAINLIEIPETI